MLETQFGVSGQGARPPPPSPRFSGGAEPQAARSIGRTKGNRLILIAHIQVPLQISCTGDLLPRREQIEFVDQLSAQDGRFLEEGRILYKILEKLQGFCGVDSF